MQDRNDNVTPESIEDGSYYRAGRQWYSDLFHRPLAERSYYIVVILLGIINGYFALISFTQVFPLATPVPFPIFSYDAFEDIPRIRRLATSRHEDRNVAVMKFFLRQYVESRESFDKSLYEFRFRNVSSMSDVQALERYKAIFAPTNPYHPYRLYGEKEHRDIDIESIAFERGPEVSHAQVVFTATVVAIADGTEVSHSKWEADITYRYTDFTVDQSLDAHAWVARLLGLTGKHVAASGEKRKVVPMTFKVSDYQVKELLE